VIYALVLSAFLGSSAYAADETQAETLLRTKVWDAYPQGWGLRTLSSTTLAAGATRSYLVTLYAGNSYRLLGVGDDSTKNLDVYLYDLEGKVVAQDGAEGREPVIEFKPTATATYYIVLHARTLVEGKTDAGVAMAVTYK
jgi:hypothetical protein